MNIWKHWMHMAIIPIQYSEKKLRVRKQIKPVNIKLLLSTQQTRTSTELNVLLPVGMINSLRPADPYLRQRTGSKMVLAAHFIPCCIY